MKLKLTEEQLHNLYRRLDLLEQTSPTGTTTGTTTTTTGSTQSNKDDAGQAEVEKSAPMLSKFLKLLAKPGETIINAIGNAFNPSGSSGEGGGYTGGGAPEFAVNIPPGSELMHPLGPKYKITSGFGYRNIGGGASQNHRGSDIGAPVGTPIYAVQDGKVLRAGDTTPNGCGGFIKLDHPTVGLQTKYCHCSRWVVKDGDVVKKGQVIGYTGGARGAQYAGNSQGPHLHYEVLNSGGIAMNPTIVHSDMA
jgi:murein DD-endopeptidase MepM/ murein hydrolase activator NlpD